MSAESASDDPTTNESTTEQSKTEESTTDQSTSQESGKMDRRSSASRGDCSEGWDSPFLQSWSNKGADGLFEHFLDEDGETSDDSEPCENPTFADFVGWRCDELLQRREGMDSGESTDTEAAGERAKAAQKRAKAERRRSKPGLTSVGRGGWSYDSDDSMEREWLLSKVPERRLHAAIDE